MDVKKAECNERSTKGGGIADYVQGADKKLSFSLQINSYQWPSMRLQVMEFYGEK